MEKHQPPSAASRATPRTTATATSRSTCAGRSPNRWAIPRRCWTGPVVGIVDTGSGFNNCHRTVPELIEAVKRGVLAAGGLPLDFPTVSLCEPSLFPTIDALPQSRGHGHRGDAPRAADGCRGADGRLRQDRAGAAHGRGVSRYARHPAGHRTDAGRAVPGRAGRRLHRLPPLLGQVPRGRDQPRTDRRGGGPARDHRGYLRGDGHRLHHGLHSRSARHDAARPRRDPGGARGPAAGGGREPARAVRWSRAGRARRIITAARSRTRCGCCWPWAARPTASSISPRSPGARRARSPAAAERVSDRRRCWST